MEKAKRLIDASALVDKLEGLKSVLYGWEDYNTGIDSAVYQAENAPTVDAVEVVHGRWEPRTDVFGFVRCSVCHDCNIYDDWADGKKWNYCPNCGAKMDGGANHEK